MKKIQKAQLINEYLKTSSVAQKKKAQAIILDDGRIEYQMISRNGRYMMKVQLMEILNTLNGPEMRELYGKISN